jgi:hypothetical protein
MNISMLRTRWAAIGAAVAVTIGAGGIGISYATSPAGAAAYVPITPCRLADTRPAPDDVGPRNTPIVAGSSLTVLAHGENGNCKAATGNAIPATATGLQLNVTGIGATTPTFVTVWPTGAAQPVTSNLNLVPGAAPTPNAVTTGLSLDGKFDIANGIGSVNVIVDVVGYYTDHQHTGADIVDETLTGADVQNNTISSADTQNEPGISTNFMTTVVNATATPAAIATTSMRVPADGYVEIQVTGAWRNAAAGSDEAFCQLQKGTVGAVDTAQPWFLIEDRNTEVQYATFSAHRIMPISVADNPLFIFSGQSLHLVCDETAGDVSFDDVFISATYFASEYEPQPLVIFPSEAELAGPEVPEADQPGPND